MKQMSEGQSPSTIRCAFPLLLDEEITKLVAGLTPQCPVAALTSSTDADSAFDRLAAWMLCRPATCLGTALPGLWLLRDEPIQDARAPGRLITILSRMSITVWGDVLEFTPSMLCDLQGFREGDLQQFLAVTARISAEACCRGAPPSRCPVVDVFEQRLFLPKASRGMSELHGLVDWACNEAGAKTVSDMIAACQNADSPHDIALLSKSLGRIPLASLFSGFERTDSLEKLIHDLCEGLDQRSRLIFLSRISANNARTLEDLAGEVSLTRERVRQLHVNAEATINQALRSRRYAPVAWRAHTLAGLLGAAIPRDTAYFQDSIRQVTREVSDAARDLVTDILLWLAGPYHLDSASGWLQSDEMPERSIVNDCSDSNGRVNIDRVRQVLSERGLVPAVHNDWIGQFGRVKQIEGSWIIWTGTVADKAVRLLDVWGEPATPEVLVRSIGEGHDVRGARSSLYSDERVMRVDMTRVGLRSWGMEEYSGIADEINQELERRGGVAEIGDVISTLVERFGLSEASIRAYLGVPMFVLEGSMVRRRISADSFPAVPPIIDTSCCYQVGPDTLSWRIDVNADIIRGSGRQIPAPIGRWLGVMPGGQRILDADGGTVRITWPLSSLAGPALGSIRFLAERVAARLGDQILLLFRRDNGSIEASRVDSAVVDASQGLERLALLTGISSGGGEAALLHRLGVALGVRGTRAAVSAKLRQRGEGTLAAHVPLENASPELDAAIDALKDLF